ncbi:hypothetical protein CSKR_104111 [Clonorchis sinensis]|uniref:Uncharacterized protein n=1 Tax=Clonorchis sinensis TaxID=79923 RepID=A0A419QBL6_CLOSI|nr:hypothetical protein CSKR_104111 [Clonorchis sinensis]
MNLCELQGAAHSVMFNVANNNVVSVTSMTARRERRSVIPLEQRQQSRRLKKQNLERRRRACISVKLNALYTLAMQLIGEDISFGLQPGKPMFLGNELSMDVDSVLEYGPHSQVKI